MLEVFILGTAGFIPLRDRHLSSCALRAQGKVLLIDAGEGTQLAYRACGLSLKKIDAILLTHCHADHTAGLPGLFLTMGNEGRRERVEVYGPAGTRRLLDAVRVIAPEIPFATDVAEWPEAGGEREIGSLAVTAFPCDHRVPCVGYRMEMKRAGRFMPEKAREKGVPVQVWSALQKNGSAEYGGVLYRAQDVLGPERKGIRFLYATDSRPVEDMVRLGKGADMMVLEGMYADEEKLPQAVEKKHMTAQEAARIAQRAGASRLVLTHFSPALTDPLEAENAARQIFAEARAGCDGMTAALTFGGGASDAGEDAV